uniref:Uncharacterized protein n=1 Tax=Anopheles minimus TaxID=112268 RepID=A0A182WCB8_9DIPT
MKVIVFVSVVLVHLLPVRTDQTDFNHINSDGSFAFGLKNSDTPGAHYHTASGNPKTIVRGRYGSRQPDTGRVEETIYTAGPRGFRARGPKIHRKQSLSQVQRGPIGTPEDPLADPYDDPSYDFQFKTRNYQRREGSDSNGRVNGLYSYIDDVGEKHSVRYSAGSGTGYEVANPVPDAPNTIAYESPLYKTHKQVRGKVAFESGPSGSGQYKLLSVGPDQRRAETTGPDGVTRGSYSYLDDKGVQRTVQYIAGAGIGYKVVQSTVGAGTHRLPQPNFGINHVEQSEIGDNNNPSYQTAPSGPASERPGSSGAGYDHVARPSAGGYDGGSNRPTAPGGSYDPPTGPSGAGSNYPDGSKPGIPGYPESSRPTGQGYDEEDFDSKRPTTSSPSLRPPTTDRPAPSSDSSEASREKYPLPDDSADHDLGGYGDDSIIGLLPPKYDYEAAGPGPSGADHDHDQPPLSGPFDVAISSGPSGPAPYPSFGESAPGTNAYNSNDFSGFPEVTYDQKKLEDDRKKDWRDFAKDSTIIKNVGDWYVGLAPGASVRAHIQNIDLLPYGGRAPSPGDALRRDTQAQAKAGHAGGRKPYDGRCAKISVLITMAFGCIHPMLTWMVLLLVGVIPEQGYGWNQPSTYYQGAASGGYFGGRGSGSLGNQAQVGASAGSWNAGAVGSSGGGGFQGQTGGGASGGLDQTVGFGANQWTGGNGALRGVAGGVSTAGDGFGADGTGSGASLATGSEGGVGYNNQGNLGNFGSSSVGVGQFPPHHLNGPVPANAFGGSFGTSGTGFGAGGHYHGSQPSTSPYGAPLAQPWRYGTPTNVGGYGAARLPWHGYVYRVPVAHINPDGSYSFSYYTPHSSREETGHSNGNVEGTYGFQNDGAKHNFSFNAAPDVDLRTNFDGSRAGVLNPDEYGPQSVHSRARLPLVPQTNFQAGVDEQATTGNGGRPQVPNSWSSRSGVAEGGNDQSALAVVGLPKTSTEATDISQPTVTTTARNQIVRGSTESVSVSDLEGRVSQPNGVSLTSDGMVTTTPPLGGSVEQVVTRPENEVPTYSNEIGTNDMQYNGVADGSYSPFAAGAPNVPRFGTVSPDRSYRFGYQTPDATREETADRTGNVRGSFSYNNEAGRNDLQYVAGAGMGFRPTGGSLSVPNGLTGSSFLANGGSLSVPNGQRVDGSAGAAGAFGGSGLVSNGVVGNQGGSGVGGTFGGSGTGFGGSGVVGNQGGPFGGSGLEGSGVVGSQGRQGLGGTIAGSGNGFEGNGVVGNQGVSGVGGPFGGSGTGFGGNGVVGNQGGQGVGGTFGGSDFGGERGVGVQTGAGQGGNFAVSAAGFGADGRPLVFGNQGNGAGFGSDGRTLGFGNQGTQQGGGGTFGGSNTGFGADGRPSASGNQAGSFGGFDGRPFGNQARQGFSSTGTGSTVGFTGNQGTTHNPVTRSPATNAFNGASTGPWNGSGTTNQPVADQADESTTINEDDSEQTTTFGGYGDVAGAGLFASGNRRLVQ